MDRVRPSRRSDENTGYPFPGSENPEPFSKEYRLRSSDGVYRWMFDVASPRVNGDGSFGGFIGSAIDTTDQKLAQQALEKVSGQLIEAQEKERSRIARDLHDDICQRLALLSMELEQANRSSDGSPARYENEPGRNPETLFRDSAVTFSHCRTSCTHQSSTTWASWPQYRGFCEEFSKQHEVNIEFSERNVPTDLPKDVSLCLFRDHAGSASQCGEVQRGKPIHSAAVWHRGRG